MDGKMKDGWRDGQSEGHTERWREGEINEGVKG